MKVSRFLTGLLLGIHIGAMILVALTPAEWFARIALWVFLGLSLFLNLQRHAWRTGPQAIAAAEIDDEGQISVRFRAGEVWHTCQPTSVLVHPWLTVLSLKPENRRWPINLVIAADAVEPEPFRRWRVAMKLHSETA